MTITRTLASIAIAAAALVGVASPAIASAQSLPSCQFEDGNVDGTECVWSEPDTGQTYFVDSANYR